MPARLWLLPLVLAALGAVLVTGRAGAQWAPDGNATCVSPNDQLLPRSCTDGLGGVIITWTDSRSGPYTLDIYAQHVNAAGQPQWGADGVPICTASGTQTTPVITVDGARGAIIAWLDHRGATNDIYVQRVSVSGVVQWTADGVALCTAVDDQFEPRITADGLGGAIVSWEDYRSGVSADVYAQRVNAAGVPRWTANGIGVCATADDQIAPDLTRDGGNGAILTWFDSRGVDFDIYAQRVDSAGVAQWTASGIPVCAALGSQEDAVIAADGSGGAVVTWADFRVNGFNSDVYAQRIDSAGNPRWLADGVALSSAAGDQSFPVIAPDGLGGAIVAWEDSRAGRPDIYAQRVNSAGAMRWGADGLGLGTLTGSQLSPAIVPTPAGGAIVAWEDGRKSTFNSDIYAQRVDSAGVAQWSPNGVAVSAAGGDQAAPTIAPDILGGAIIAWEDGRSGMASDIYAQRVTATGYVGPTASVADATTLEFRMLPSLPNPSRGPTTLAFVLPVPGRVTADIFGTDGRKVRSLAAGESLPAGVREIAWDGRDRAGARVSPGIYLARVRTERGSGVAKLTMLK